MTYRPRPLEDIHYAVLRSVTDKPERTRTIAARYSGLSEGEAVNSGPLTEVSRALQLLDGHGLIRREDFRERPYTAYVLTVEGAKVAGFGDLLEQAA